MKLNELAIGKRAKIVSVGGEGSLRQHFLDMGIIPGAILEMVKYAPMGDPIEVMVHGYVLTLRLADASCIDVTEVSGEVNNEPNNLRYEKIDHPGLGEGGRYHSKADENPLPEEIKLTFALAGNQNSGKTTLFNQLTGSNQHVGNFPGVTVDKKEGVIRNYPNTLVTDLPGIYSLSPYSAEEIVSRNFILDEDPKGIINIVDATNIERNLFLTLQLMELDKPMVLALNMMDEVTSNGGEINVNLMEELLGIPVVLISAAKNEGVDELISHSLHVAKYQEKPTKTDYCDKEDYGGAVHRCLHAIMHLIEDHALAANIPLRFAATKIVEGDSQIIERLNLTQNELETVEHIICQMEEERGLDRAAAIADMRFNFITKVCTRSVKKPKISKQSKRSEKIDKVLTGKYTAIPMFILIMGLVFFLTFNVVGAALQDLFQMGIDALSGVVDNLLTKLDVSVALHSLIIDGLFQGIGSVLSFVPIIVIMFLFLSLLEDSGYLTRVAFIMDKPLRKIGLSGKSIVPMLVGFGCTVPAVMSTRTLASERDRKMTIMLTPFMSCSAKLPIYGFLAKAFDMLAGTNIAWLIMIGLYLLGIVLGIIVALISKKVAFKGEAVPFVMELPNYRLPTFKTTIRLLWDKTKDFIQRAFGIILIATLAIWFLNSFNFKFELVEQSESILASIGGFIAPIFAPLGFGSKSAYPIPAALVTGFLAKESVVSTLEVLLSGASILTIVPSISSILALVVFCSLYTPCVAAIASIKRELGTKWAIGTVLFQCGVAYLIAMIVRLICLLFGV